jgi:2-isopropylmalate synthase
MHVHAVNRVAASYEHIDPQAVGNERRVLVSELSGRSNIGALTTGRGLDADPKLMDQILSRVVELENQGYQFEAAQGSFDLLVQKCIGAYKPHFERINYRVNVETDQAGNVIVGRESTTQKHSVLLRETENLVVVPSSGRLVAALGVRDLIIVDTPDAVLVCPRERAQEVKQLVDHLKELGQHGYI